MEMICEHDNCSGCQACVSVCPVQAISMQEDELSTLLPVIDQEKCINCGRCKNVCPQLNSLDFNQPQITYAAWSKKADFIQNSASGGIASSLYAQALAQGIFCMGAGFAREKGVFFRQLKNTDDIRWAADSKYVYSDMRECFEQYKEQLQQDHKCLFIGLPCQVAALKKYCDIYRMRQDNLLTVDIICHGVPNYEYLGQHIQRKELAKKRRLKRLSFRNPLTDFELKFWDNDDRIFYHRPMHEDDVYYRAFALNLNFRKNCYNCQFSQPERVGDLTLGDFSGLGREKPFDKPQHKVSVVLVNTQAGKDYIHGLDNVVLIEREFREAYEAEGNPNLRHPSIPYTTRAIFEMEYLKHHNYDRAAKIALKKVLWQWYRVKPYWLVRRYLAGHMPKGMKQMLKRILRRGL